MLENSSGLIFPLSASGMASYLSGCPGVPGLKEVNVGPGILLLSSSREKLTSFFFLLVPARSGGRLGEGEEAVEEAEEWVEEVED